MSVSPAVGLGLAYAWRQRLRCALVAAGIALVVAVPVVTSGIARSVTAQAVRHAISAMPLTDRALLVSQEATSTFRVGTPTHADAVVRAQLGRLSDVPALSMLIFHELTAKGATFYLSAADRLGTAVRLTSGRLPVECTATRCEVLAIGGPRSALAPAAATLGLVVVGTAQRRNPLLLSGQLDPDNEPLLVAGSVQALSRLASLQLFARYYAWVTALDADRVVSLGVHGYLERAARVDHTLDQAVGATTFSRPDDVLQQAGDRADASARRLQLLGGFGAALLLGFAIVAGVGLRRDANVLLAVVRRRGGGRAAVAAVGVTATAVCAVAGAVAGAVLGGAGAAVWRTGTGTSAWSAAWHAFGQAWPTAAGYAVVATAAVFAVLLWPDARSSAVWRTLDLLAVACLGAVVLAAARGAASTTKVAAGDPLVVTLPALASVVAGLIAARAWGPAAAFGQRLLPQRAIGGRIALLGSLRRPLRTAATTAFLTAAVAAVVFAGAYRATLLAGDADEAAFRVPADVTLGPSAQQAVPSHVVDPAAVRAAGAHAYGVLRAQATVVRLAGVSDTVSVLAVDDGALDRAHRWQRTSGGPPAAQLSRRLGSAVPVAAPVLPEGTRTIRIAARGADPQTTLTLVLRDAAWRETAVSLHAAGGGLVGTLPAGSTGVLSAAAFAVDEAPDYATHHAHAVGEGNTDQPLLSGQITLGAVRADGRRVPWAWSAWGSATGTVRTGPSSLRLSYRLAGDPVVAVPGYAAVRGAVLPIAVDPATAQDATGGTLPFLLDGTTRVTGRIVATLPRLPTVDGPFLLADRAALQQLADTIRPGRAPSEYWVAGSSRALDRLLATAPYDTLTVTSRARVEAALDADPVGRGSRLLLALVALLALGVAALSMVLLVVGERRDGAGEFFAWEADGLAPPVLRRVLLLRAVAAAVVAVPLGAAAGLVVAGVGADLVSVDALGRTPVPPLEVTLGTVWTPLGLLAGIGAGLVVCAAVALLSLRERTPVPAPVELR
jgi:hypothetical protein